MYKKTLSDYACLRENHKQLWFCFIVMEGYYKITVGVALNHRHQRSWDSLCSGVFAFFFLPICKIEC